MDCAEPLCVNIIIEKPQKSGKQFYRCCQMRLFQHHTHNETTDLQENTLKDCCPPCRRAGRPEDSIPVAPQVFLLGYLQCLSEPGSCPTMLDTVLCLHNQQSPKQPNLLSVSEPGNNQHGCGSGGDPPDTIRNSPQLFSSFTGIALKTISTRNFLKCNWGSCKHVISLKIIFEPDKTHVTNHNT